MRRLPGWYGYRECDIRVELTVFIVLVLGRQSGGTNGNEQKEGQRSKSFVSAVHFQSPRRVSKPVAGGKHGIGVPASAIFEKQIVSLPKTH
jgi:hypothetical protein